MNGIQTRLALDSCVVIDLVDRPGLASGLRGRLKGKQIRIVLCDVVLGEVKRVRGLSPRRVIERISVLLNRSVERVHVDADHKREARNISSQFHICHNGDNKILSICKAMGFILLTSDRMLLKACEFVGVPGFHPTAARGI